MAKKGQLAIRNGDSSHGTLATQEDWGRVADLLGPLRVTPDQLRKFAAEPGSDEEPWDVLLSMLALDEHTALTKLAERTGLRFVSEPRLHESSSKFYEVVPPDVARRLHVAGLESDGKSMTIVTAQPMQAANFSRLEENLGMPIRIVLSPRAGVANLRNRNAGKRAN